jgi:hypothetical protein
VRRLSIRANSCSPTVATVIRSPSPTCQPLRLRVRGLSTTKEAYAFRVFEAVFKQFGLPKVMRTDNGVPFASPNPLFCVRAGQSNFWRARRDSNPRPPDSNAVIRSMSSNIGSLAGNASSRLAGTVRLGPPTRREEKQSGCLASLLASNAKALYGLPVAGVPNRPARLQRLHCSNRNTPECHCLVPA